MGGREQRAGEWAGLLHTLQADRVQVTGVGGAGLAPGAGLTPEGGAGLRSQLTEASLTQWHH